MHALLVAPESHASWGIIMAFDDLDCVRALARPLLREGKRREDS